MVDRLNAIDGLYCPRPTGAFYVYPSGAGVIGRRTPDGRVIANDSDFVMYLLESQDVGVIQGAPPLRSHHSHPSRFDRLRQFRAGLLLDHDGLREFDLADHEPRCGVQFRR